jgi:hypothetical protein
VVEQKSGSGTVQTKITIGDTYGAWTQVKSGLKVGDQVAVTVPGRTSAGGNTNGTGSNGGYGGFPGGGGFSGGKGGFPVGGSGYPGGKQGTGGR